MKIDFEPIGQVRRLTGDALRWDRPETVDLVLREELAPALSGLDGYSHLHVLFHFDRIDPEDRTLTVRPEERDDMPDLGVFATCSPLRPNPIGMTLVRLLSVAGCVVRVEGLDALDGTPILDLKPCGETIEGIRVPEWLERLEAEG